MIQKNTHRRFDGARWFEQQVQRRTRAALTERGSTASAHSREYKTEYARQLKLFRAERKEIKRRKAEKHAALRAKKKQEQTAQCR